MSQLKAIAVLAAFAIASCGAPTSSAPASAPAPEAGAAAAPAQSQDIAPPPASFRHEPGAAVFGYYLPTLAGGDEPIAIGDVVLEHLHIGTDEDLAAWEAGKRVSEVYAPVMLAFADQTSPMATNALGGESHSVRPRVLPTYYELTRDRLVFIGYDSVLGDVSFTGAFDRAALEAAQSEGVSSEPVLRGSLTAGGKSFEPVEMTYFQGD